MKAITLFLVVLIASLAVIGCDSGTTSNSDVANAAAELNKKAEGVQPQPDPAVANINGGSGPAAATAPKPGKR